MSETQGRQPSGASVAPVHVFSSISSQPHLPRLHPGAGNGGSSAADEGPSAQRGRGRGTGVLCWQPGQPDCLSPCPAGPCAPPSLCRKLHGPSLQALEAPRAGPSAESRVPSRPQVSSLLSEPPYARPKHLTLAPRCHPALHSDSNRGPWEP